MLEKWLAGHAIPGPLFLVGGTVRDIIMDRPVRDIDLVCKGAKELAHTLASGRNSAVVPMEKKTGEPCYRVVDRENTGNFLDIAEMRGGTIYEDLHKRDFTINAIAIEIRSDGKPGEFYDALTGIHDIKNRVIRIAGAAAMESDPLRILRAFRFSAELEFDIEAVTLAEIRNRAGLITTVSSERIVFELLLILKTRRSSMFFRQMEELGVLSVIFPEIVQMKDCPQNWFHHKDVWEHSMMVMENCEDIINSLQNFFKDYSKEVAENLAGDNRLQLTKLAALLHDIGKPLTRGLNETTGRITFYGHDSEGARLIENISNRLKMSNTDSAFLALMVAEHLHLFDLSKDTVRPATKTKWFRRMHEDAIPVIIIAMADVKGTLGNSSTEEFRDFFIGWAKETVREYYQTIKKTLERKILVSGDDLIELGIKPGPEMGRMLEQIRTAQDTGEINTKEEALKMAQNLKKEVV